MCRSRVERLTNFPSHFHYPIVIAISNLLSTSSIYQLCKSLAILKLNGQLISWPCKFFAAEWMNGYLINLQITKLPVNRYCLAFASQIPGGCLSNCLSFKVKMKIIFGKRSRSPKLELDKWKFCFQPSLNKRCSNRSGKGGNDVIFFVYDSFRMNSSSPSNSCSENFSLV